MTHLAASHTGVAAFRTAARRHEGTAFGPELSALAGEVEADRQSLRGIADRVGALPDSLAHRAAQVALEGVGRLSRLVNRATGAGRVVGIENLRTAVAAKTAGWEVMSAIADRNDGLDNGELDTLLVRACDQAARLRNIHLQMAIPDSAIFSDAQTRHRLPPSG